MVCNNPNLKCSHSVKFSYIWDNRFASNQCVMESKILTLHLMHLGSSYYALKHVYKEYTSRSSRVCSLVQGLSNDRRTRYTFHSWINAEEISLWVVSALHRLEQTSMSNQVSWWPISVLTRIPVIGE